MDDKIPNMHDQEILHLQMQILDIVSKIEHEYVIIMSMKIWDGLLFPDDRQQSNQSIKI